jgi:hypothetical protein
MIESYYWREDLLDHARRLRPVKNPKRWSERALVIFEKELMISFYIVRTLLERDKTSKKSDDYRVSVRCVPWNGRSLTKLNYFDIERLYSFDREFDDKISVKHLANQFIHSRAIFAIRDKTRNWSEIMLCSDLQAKNVLYRASIDEIRKTLLFVGKDYAESLSYIWDPKIEDYQVKRG